MKVKLNRYITTNDNGEVEGRYNPYNLPEDQGEYYVDMKDYYSYNTSYAYDDDYGYGSMFANKKTRRYNQKLQTSAAATAIESEEEDAY
jgi:hypothetical protein